MKNRKKQNSIILICVAAGVCLIGAAVTALAVLRQKNPLAEGLENLAEEVTAGEAELGEYFWTDIVNQAGGGNVQAEYSINIGGVPALQGVTAGLDGKVKRDMDGQLFETDMQVSVTNLKLAEISISAVPETLFVQVPSIWDGSVVLRTEDVSGQWDDSSVRAQLQNLTGQELGIGQNIDVQVLEEFSIESFSVSGFLRENEEALKTLYENMEVLKIEKAVKEGKLSESQMESLENVELEDADGNRMEADCYLAVLPKRELGEIFRDVTSDIRLAVYLDKEKRIVRASTLPEEVLVTDGGNIKIGLNLAGVENTIDRLEITVSGVIDTAGTVLEGVNAVTEKAELESSLIIEKETDKKGIYIIEGNAAVTDENNSWEFSVKSGVQGEQAAAGGRLSLDVKNLTLKSSGETVCRISGTAALEPLTESIEMPSGKEYPIGEMNDVETMLFLAECMGNVYENYGGYLKLLQ